MPQLQDSSSSESDSWSEERSRELSSNSSNNSHDECDNNSFPSCHGFKEDPFRRNMRPTFHHLLELSRLSRNFDLERVESKGLNVQIYIGTEISKIQKKTPSKVLFVRGISHSLYLMSYSGARRALLSGLDELERAQFNSKVAPNSSSRIFLHYMQELADMDTEVVLYHNVNLVG